MIKDMKRRQVGRNLKMKLKVDDKKSDESDKNDDHDDDDDEEDQEMQLLSSSHR